MSPSPVVAQDALIKYKLKFNVNRYRRKRPKVDARIFDSALSYTRRSDASEKKDENSRVHFWTFSPVDKLRVLACIVKSYNMIDIYLDMPFMVSKALNPKSFDYF